jgi:hypothetical protein
LSDEDRIEKIADMAIKGDSDEFKIKAIGILATYIGEERIDEERGYEYEAISTICDIAISSSVEVKEQAFKVIGDRCGEKWPVERPHP